MISVSRWFFRWLVADEAPEVVRHITSLPIRGACGPGFSITEETKFLYAIVMEPRAWKLDQQTWYRKDIRLVLPQFVHSKMPRYLDKTNLAVWTRYGDALPERDTVRIISEREARDEATASWNWIVHICRQQVRVQKAGGLAEGVDKWLRDSPEMTLPGSPFSPRSNKRRSSRSTWRTSVSASRRSKSRKLSRDLRIY